MASRLPHTFPHTAAVYQAKIAVLEAQITLLKAEMREKEIAHNLPKTPMTPSPEREEQITRTKSAPPKSAPPAPKKQKVSTDAPKATGGTPRAITFDDDLVGSRAQTNDAQPQSPLW